jgi:hypothetical protein
MTWKKCGMKFWHEVRYYSSISPWCGQPVSGARYESKPSKYEAGVFPMQL